MADALGVGLSRSDEGFKPPLQLGGRDLVEAVVDFAGLNQIATLAPADIEAVPLRAIECEAGNGQRFPLQVFLTQSFVGPLG